MKVMEGGGNISSSLTTKRKSKSFRKLGWKNYLNHLLNLWLYCGNVLVDGRNYGENGGVVNVYHESDSTTTSSFTNSSFKTLSTTFNVRDSEKFSYLNHSVLHARSSKDDVVALSNVNASNNSKLSEKYFNFTKSLSVKRSLLNNSTTSHEKSLNTSSISSTVKRKGPVKITNRENIVNTTRLLNETAKYVNRGNGLENSIVESIKSIDNNQSSNHNPSMMKNSTKNAKKKSKSRTNAKNSTVKRLTNHRGVKKLSKVSLLGLFEMTTHLGTRWEGKSELAAAKLAVKHVNERQLLPGYVLELITNDTQVRRLNRAWHA